MGRLLPASFWIEQAEQAVREGMLVLSLTGGETLLYPELDALMEALMPLGLLISFNTNGTLIDEKRVDWFLRHPPAKINISLYGASDDTYARLCGMKDGFSHVSRAIELLQKAGLNVYLNAVLVPENIHELPAMQAWSAAHGLVLHIAAYIFPPRGSAGRTECVHRLSPAEAAHAGCAFCALQDGEQAFRQSAANTVAQLDEIQAHGRRPGFRPCRAAACSFAITWDGKMRPCVLFESIQEGLEDGFAAAWQRMGERIGEMRVPAPCVTCPRLDICPVCLSAIHQESAAPDVPPAYLCAFSEALEAELRRAGEGIAPTALSSAAFQADGCNDG